MFIKKPRIIKGAKIIIGSKSFMPARNIVIHVGAAILNIRVPMVSFSIFENINRTKIIIKIPLIKEKTTPVFSSKASHSTNP